MSLHTGDLRTGGRRGAGAGCVSIASHRMHQCPYCGYSTRKAAHFSFHDPIDKDAAVFDADDRVGLDTSRRMSGGGGAPGAENDHSTVTKKRMCLHCPYSTNVATNFRNHMRTHTGEKPFSCSFCPYSAITKDNLKRHIRGHTRESSFECPMCPFKCIDKSAIMNHMVTHHPQWC
ncbi:zinc finger protein 513-like [Penaeus chinensis]|uniref:zinc finger protein 513-like n=1 Tax=Penaeus chinensis TaxID=139456 RepID=UPI001FB77FB1|nr:zinc finger protein 513-like [Penaeus chinensis]